MARSRKTATSTKNKARNRSPRQLLSNAKVKFYKHQIVYSVVGTVIVIGLLTVVLFFFRKDLFLAGNINGKLITTPQFYSRLAQENGEATFDALVRETLIRQEAQKKNITVSQEDIDKEIKVIEDRFGGKEGLAQALEANNTSMQQLEEQIEIQVLVKKIFDGEAQVTDKEIDEYIKQNKEFTEGLSREEVVEQMKSTKLNDAFSKWFEEARKGANIQKFFK